MHILTLRVHHSILETWRKRIQSISLKGQLFQYICENHAPSTTTNIICIFPHISDASLRLEGLYDIFETIYSVHYIPILILFDMTLP